MFEKANMYLEEIGIYRENIDGKESSLCDFIFKDDSDRKTGLKEYVDWLKTNKPICYKAVKNRINIYVLKSIIICFIKLFSLIALMTGAIISLVSAVFYEPLYVVALISIIFLLSMIIWFIYSEDNETGFYHIKNLKKSKVAEADVFSKDTVGYGYSNDVFVAVSGKTAEERRKYALDNALKDNAVTGIEIGNKIFLINTVLIEKDCKIKFIKQDLYESIRHGK